MKTEQATRIREHGMNLLRIFRKATEKDPFELCHKLIRLERAAGRIALRLCNGPEFAGGYEEVDALLDKILVKVNALLGNKKIPIFINRDPRGCALKIQSEWMESHPVKIHRDWGGYGIIAPEL